MVLLVFFQFEYRVSGYYFYNFGKGHYVASVVLSFSCILTALTFTLIAIALEQFYCFLLLIALFLGQGIFPLFYGLCGH